MPSLVERPAFFVADASPRLRRMVVASSRLPPASARAALHSIIPAPVASRSFFTIAAVISMSTPRTVVNPSFIDQGRRASGVGPAVQNNAGQVVRPARGRNSRPVLDGGGGGCLLGPGLARQTGAAGVAVAALTALG